MFYYLFNWKHKIFQRKTAIAKEYTFFCLDLLSIFFTASRKKYYLTFKPIIANLSVKSFLKFWLAPLNNNHNALSDRRPKCKIKHKNRTIDLDIHLASTYGRLTSYEPKMEFPPYTYSAHNTRTQ